MLQNKISYGYYFNDYCMGQTPILSDAEFCVYEARAREFLRGICIKQIPGESLDDVFACICALAEEMFSQKKCKNIKSESTDGYSVTFSEVKNVKKNLWSIASLYLGNSGLLYAGVE